jgi:GrpB-like predicted nucleotidyltransferase (UPF0157 family)
MRQNLGHLVLAIEHVGSTSVPGLAAKPIIDVDIVIESPAQLPPVAERLAGIGYTHQGDLGIAGRHAFDAPPAPPPRHVYVCPRDSIPLREHLAFRDFLRSNPEAAASYAELKRQLCNACADDRAQYTERKAAFVRGVLARHLRATS